jgi:hypothetical protein
MRSSTLPERLVFDDGPGEADARREEAMTDAATGTGQAETFARVLEARLEQGYKIESQSATEAIITMKGRKRLLKSSTQSRQRVTIGEDGRASFEKLD